MWGLNLRQLPDTGKAQLPASVRVFEAWRPVMRPCRDLWHWSSCDPDVAVHGCKNASGALSPQWDERD